MHLPADLIAVGGNVVTLDPRRPRASAIAVRGGRIVATGDDGEVLRLAGHATRKLDLAGRTVVPGFIDSHVHLLWYGSQLLHQADLVGCRDIDELLSRVGELARRKPEGWLQGHGFDQSKMAEGRFVTRAELDEVSATRPIILSRVCGHAAVVNSAALALVTTAERAAGDESSGLYTEEAISAFYRKVPPPTDEEMEQAVLAGARVALRTGITSVQTMLDVPEQMRGYAGLQRKGRLPLRVIGMPPAAAVNDLHRHGIRSGFGDARLRFGACKFFSDGSLGAQTALLSEPYADKPDTRGIGLYEPADLAARCRDAQGKGWQLAIHAIGDAALRMTLDAIEHALDGAGNAEHRHRVEHASICPPDCVERLARRKVVVTLQPQFVTSDTWTPDRIGPSRVPWAYPFRDLVEAGVPVALSSDCPVERLDAFACLAAAVGGHPWRPGQTLTGEQALRAYCLGSAYAGFAEADVGSLESGKRADLVVLSGDPTALDATVIAALTAERVFVGGEERSLPDAT